MALSTAAAQRPQRTPGPPHPNCGKYSSQTQHTTETPNRMLPTATRLQIADCQCNVGQTVHLCGHEKQRTCGGQGREREGRNGVGLIAAPHGHVGHVGRQPQHLQGRRQQASGLQTQQPLCRPRRTQAVHVGQSECPLDEQLLRGAPHREAPGDHARNPHIPDEESAAPQRRSGKKHDRRWPQTVGPRAAEGCPPRDPRPQPRYVRGALLRCPGPSHAKV